MILRSFYLIFLLLFVTAAGSYAATLVDDFEFSGNLTDAIAPAASLYEYNTGAPNSSQLGSSTWSWTATQAPGAGLCLHAGLSQNQAAYSIAIRFKVTQVLPDTGWRKIISFHGHQPDHNFGGDSYSDSGIYTTNGGLNFYTAYYGSYDGNYVLTPEHFYYLVFTRDASQNVNVYCLNTDLQEPMVPRITFNDYDRKFVFDTAVGLFYDDIHLTGLEFFSDGIVDAVRVWDGALTADEITDEPLPVELSSFTATATADYLVELNWTTQSESNLSGYYIYRNTTGNLNSALRIQSLINATNTSQETTYNFTDEEVETGHTYWYWLESLEMSNESEFHGPISVTLSDHGGSTLPQIPSLTLLRDAYPNPFSYSCRIPYSVKGAARVNIEIYNLKGQLVWSDTQSHTEAGYYHTTWNVRDLKGTPAASGIYYYKMTSGNYTGMKKVILIN
jgi:hypothetical protein